MLRGITKLDMYLWRKTGRDTVVTNAIWKLQRKYMSRSKEREKNYDICICWNDWCVLWLDDTNIIICIKLLNSHFMTRNRSILLFYDRTD